MFNMIVTTLIAALFLIVDADRKVWKQTNSLGIPGLWDQDQLPCQGQSIVLPQDVIYVPANFHFGPETILPRDNGLLIFSSDGTNSIFELDLKEDSGCKRKNPDQAAQFKIAKYSNWYDPQHWSSEYYHNGPNSPIPHIQRVPCRFDQVIFPPQAAYKVRNMAIFLMDILTVNLNK